MPARHACLHTLGSPATSRTPSFCCEMIMDGMCGFPKRLLRLLKEEGVNSLGFWCGNGDGEVAGFFGGGVAHVCVGEVSKVYFRGCAMVGCIWELVGFGGAQMQLGETGREWVSIWRSYGLSLARTVRALVLALVVNFGGPDPLTGCPGFQSCLRTASFSCLLRGPRKSPPLAERACSYFRCCSRRLGC